MEWKETLTLPIPDSLQTQTDLQRPIESQISIQEILQMEPIYSCHLQTKNSV